MARRVWPRRLKLVLEAGNKLDAYIHENVFEECAHILEFYEEDNSEPWDDYITWRCSKCALTFRGLYYSGFGHARKLLCPEYSTKDVDTLKLMYKLQMMDKIISVDFEPKGTFSASLLAKDDDDDCWSSKGMAWEQPTFPMAICTALIKSMEQEDVASKNK